MSLPFGNNTITVYKYEPFGYSFPKPVDASSILIASVTSGLPISLFTPAATGVPVTTDISFSSTGFNGATSTNELFVLNALDASSNVKYRSSNTVNILAGRFTSPASNTTYTFYVNEPITPVVFSSFINISGVLTSPTLPPGLTFVNNDICSARLQGTPVVEFPTCNYQIIGRDSGKVVTTRVNIGVKPERVQLNVSGTPIVNLTVGSPITPATVTAKYPDQAASNLVYTWAGLPDGIHFTDNSGNIQTSPFFPTDASSTIKLSGTPTIQAAYAFANAGITSNDVTLNAIRVSSPNISNSNSFTFIFQPTVLFDPVTIPPLYTNLAVPSGISFRAKTYFGSDASITSIFSPDLRSDLSLIFYSNQQRADLSGKALSPSSGTFTVRAINANALTRDITPSLTVTNDTVTFSVVPTDTCSAFILSRPVNVAKTGYYKYPIQFSANAASGRPIIYTQSGISATGLSLTTESNVATLTGTPAVPRSLSTLTVTATSTDTSATATHSIDYSIIDDVFTFSSSTPSPFTFIQNRPITPIQIFASTLSGRTINAYGASGLPTGLSISVTGQISGTIVSTNTSGSFTVFANTGYKIGSQTYAYTVIRDALILYTDQQSYPVSPGGNVDIQVRSISFSGRSASNYALNGLTSNYGFSIGSSTGLISGTLIDGIPPGTVLPTNCNYYVSAKMTNIDASLIANIRTTNPIVNRSFLSAKAPSTDIVPIATYDVQNYSSTPVSVPPAFPSLTDPTTIANSAPGSPYGVAYVNLGQANPVVSATYPSSYLQIYAPDLGASRQTGGIQLPSMTNVRSIETWVYLPSFGNYGQVFLDFRSGLSGGYMITSLGGQNVGADVIGATMYINGSASTITSFTNIGSLITSGWKQVVITFPSAFTDDLTFFMSYNNNPSPFYRFTQGIPVRMTEISVYDKALGPSDVIALYNSKCARYGLTQTPKVLVYRSDDSYSNWVKPTTGLVPDDGTTQIDTLPIVSRWNSVDSSSNVFFVGSTGNFYLRSSDGITFSQYRYVPGETLGSNGFGASTVLNIPGTSTWWTIGTELSNDNINYEAVLYKSDDNALTWAKQSVVDNFVTRDFNRRFRTLYPFVDGNAYFMSGAEFVYKDGVYLLGGYALGPNTSILRSTDASSWTQSAGSFMGDTAFMSLDVSGMWIATGTDQYPWNAVTQSSGFVLPTQTIKYSTDQGLSWLDVSSSFNYHGYDIAYACNTWLATGIDASGSGPSGSFYTHQLRYSKDGSGDWLVSDIPGLGLTFSNQQDSLYPLRIGRPIFDGSNWQVMITDSSGSIRVYSHDISSSFASNWIASPVISSIVDFPRRMIPANYVRSGIPTTVTLSFASATGGPAVISPSTRDFIVYQYIPIDPITIVFGAGSGNKYALLIDDDLPQGLVYNPVTQTISGTPVKLGDDDVRVFIKDDSGYSSFILTFHTIIPSFLRKQTSASAYTSYVRQYTVVNAAQNSRDNIVYPTQERYLGEFMAPDAPDVSSAVICCKN